MGRWRGPGGGEGRRAVGTGRRASAVLRRPGARRPVPRRAGEATAMAPARTAKPPTGRRRD